MAAAPGGMQVQQDPTTLGFPASFVYDSSIVFPGVERPVFSGSQLGVPPVDQIAGETPSNAVNSGAAAAGAYGQATANAAPHKQPVFWSVVLVTLGVLLMTHAADVSLRGLR